MPDDKRTNSEDKATQPMEAGGCVSQFWSLISAQEPQMEPCGQHHLRSLGQTSLGFFRPLQAMPNPISIKKFD